MKSYLLLISVLFFCAPLHAKAEHLELTAWVECLQAKATQYAKTDATVETAATAAMGACKMQEDAERYSRLKTPFGERIFLGPRSINADFIESARVQHELTRQDFRERLISMILEQRSSMAK